MNTLLKLAVVTSVSIALFGCSDGGTDTTASAAYKRVAPLDPQIATIEIHDPLGILAAPKVVIKQADKITLDAHATSGAGTVTLDMSLVNHTGRTLFNAKVVPTALSQGDVGTNTQGQTGNIHASAPDLAGLEYWGFGIKGIADGDASTGEDALTVDGIVSVDNGNGTVSNSPLIIQVALPTDHSMGFNNNWSWGDIERVDIMGNRTVNEWYDDIERGGAFQDDNAYHQGVSSADGHYIYMGSRNLPAIMVHDTTADMQSGNSPSIGRISVLENPNAAGFVSEVSISPDGAYLYATVTEGTHEYAIGSPGNVTSFPVNHYLVKVDAATHKVLSRLEVTVAGREGTKMRARDLDITEDGKLASLAMDFAGSILLVDLTGDMSIVETYDTIAEGYGERLREAAISPDGSRIFFPDESSNYSNTYSSYSASENVIAINVADGSYSTLPVENKLGSTPHEFRFGPDGRLYHVGSSTDINVYDVDAMTQVATYSGSHYMFDFDGEGKALVAFGDSGTRVYELATDTYTGLNNTGTSGYDLGVVSAY